MNEGQNTGHEAVRNPVERDLKNKNFVFIGGSGGIASHILLEIARRGANVLIVARTVETARELLAQARTAGAPRADLVQADVSHQKGINLAVEGIHAWTGTIHGLVQSAMSTPWKDNRTQDGMEWAYGLQFFARARINIALAELLDASGDGRVVHIGAKAPKGFSPDWDDLQFQRRRWSLFPALMSSQYLGYLHVQEAQRRWADKAVSLSIVCVGPTLTPAIRSQALWVRLLYKLIATTPERSARNAVTVLTAADAVPYKGAILFDPAKPLPTKLALEQKLADRVWELSK